MFTAALVLPNPDTQLRAQTAPPPSSPLQPKTSIMMWTLNKVGSYEQILERVAQAGYHQIELVSEFKS